MGKVIVEKQADVKNLNQLFWATVQKAIASHRCDVRVASAFRSYAKQAYLYALFLAGLGNPANRPGTSLHELGLATDLHPVDGDYSALADTMRSIGLATVGSKEPWHWQGDKAFFAQVARVIVFPFGFMAMSGVIVYLVWKYSKTVQTV